jgi:hypothetical protein
MITSGQVFDTRGNQTRPIVDLSNRRILRADKTSVVVAVIVSGSPIAGYLVTCYPDYPATTNSYSASLAVAETAVNSTLPADTVVLAHKIRLTALGGS